MKRLAGLIDLSDVVALVGLLLIAWGLSFESTAAALAVPGALLFFYAAIPPLLVTRDGGR